MPSNNPDSKTVNDQPAIPGWRPATVARLLRGMPSSSEQNMDEIDRVELMNAVEGLARAKRLPWTAVRIIAALLKRANKITGMCNPSASTIAADAGCGARTVERHVPLMRAYGLIDTDCQWQDGHGKGKPPKRTSNRFTFAKISIGHAAEFVAAKIAAPVLERLALARAAAAARMQAIRAAKSAKRDTITDAAKLSELRKRQGMADLLNMIGEFREAERPPEYVPLSGTGSRLIAALNRKA